MKRPKANSGKKRGGSGICGLSCEVKTTLLWQRASVWGRRVRVSGSPLALSKHSEVWVETGG